MQQGQKLNDSMGNQVVLFPLDMMEITQGEFSSFSHAGSRAMDFVGSTINYPYYAPVDLTMVQRFDLGSYVYTSDNPVRFVDGTLDYVTFWFVHDNDNYSLGRKAKQGDFLGRTGTSGYVTGDHVHIEASRGVYSGVSQNADGVWVLNNQVALYDLLSVNDTIIIQDMGYNWKEYTGGVTPPGESSGLPIWLMTQKGGR